MKVARSIGILLLSRLDAGFVSYLSPHLLCAMLGIILFVFQVIVYGLITRIAGILSKDRATAELTAKFTQRLISGLGDEIVCAAALVSPLCLLLAEIRATVKILAKFFALLVLPLLVLIPLAQAVRAEPVFVRHLRVTKACVMYSLIVTFIANHHVHFLFLRL